MRSGLCVTLLLAGCSAATQPSSSDGRYDPVECAPFARQVTGLQLFGDAASWWDQASGRYDRRAQPVQGGVLVFRRSGKLPAGHVSVVSRLLSDREILVAQANWVHHRVTRDELVTDVSADNDWSSVRVWWTPANVLGASVYPTYGFIVAARTVRRRDLAAGTGAP